MLTVSLSPLEPAETTAPLGLLEAASLPTVGVRENPTAFVVARFGDEIVGCCGVEIHGSNGLLRSLVVDARHRSRGIAKTLIDHVLSPPQHVGMDIYLLTTTARDFFLRFGFDVRSRHEAPEAIRASWEFRTGCPDTAVFMRRPSGDALAVRSCDELRAVVADDQRESGRPVRRLATTVNVPLTCSAPVPARDSATMIGCAIALVALGLSALRPTRPARRAPM